MTVDDREVLEPHHRAARSATDEEERAAADRRRWLEEALHVRNRASEAEARLRRGPDGE